MESQVGTYAELHGSGSQLLQKSEKNQKFFWKWQNFKTASHFFTET